MVFRWRGCLLKLMGVRKGFCHIEKDNQCAYGQYSNLPAQANQSFLFTF